MRKKELIRLLGALLKVFTMMNAVSAVIMGCMLDSERYGLILGILMINIAECIAYFYFLDAYRERRRKEAAKRARIRAARPRRRTYQLYNLNTAPEPAGKEPENIDMWITI